MSTPPPPSSAERTVSASPPPPPAAGAGGVGLEDLLEGALAGRRATSQEATKSLPFTASARVGRFTLVRKLAEGGMGVVYLAYDEQLDRRVAVKVLRHGLASPERLVREAQALAKVSHPNVVPVYEVGEVDGHVFLVMELVDGPTLAAFLAGAGKPPAVQEILSVFVRAGRGLEAAHAAGFVHRDFKPDNVLVGSDGRPRVIDFGIVAAARAAGDVGATGDAGVGSDGGAEGAATANLRAGGIATAAMAAAGSGSGSRSGSGSAREPITEAGTVLGTPGYMSPEQWYGHAATPASDQFSFCVALYRAVYGVAPFAGAAPAEIATHVTTTPPRPPPRVPGVPSWLAPILLRGLAARPEDRHPSLGALLDAIEVELPRHPDLDPQPTMRERLIIGVLLVAIAIALNVYIFVRGPARALSSTADLVRIAGMLFLASAVAVVVLWKRLSTNLAGRRVGYVLLQFTGTLLLHRLVAARLGMSVSQTMTVDILLLASSYAFAASVLERWFWIIAVAGLVPLAVATLAPAHAPAVFAAYATSGVTSMVVFALRRWR